jgi:N-acetylglutamate synthase-like GNAT family acetyltransferase
MVKSWWTAQNEPAPLESALPPTSYILTLQDKPALCVSLYFTNNKHVCLVENFVGNPEVKGPMRRVATEILLEFLEREARRNGVTHLHCTATKKAVGERFKEIGFRETATAVSYFVKEL